MITKELVRKFQSLLGKIIVNQEYIMQCGTQNVSIPFR